MYINIFSLIGVNSDESIAIAIFFISTWFVVEQISSATVFSPATIV
jgi:hypothetical protein